MRPVGPAAEKKLNMAIRENANSTTPAMARFVSGLSQGLDEYDRRFLLLKRKGFRRTVKKSKLKRQNVKLQLKT